MPGWAIGLLVFILAGTVVASIELFFKETKVGRWIKAKIVFVIVVMFGIGSLAMMFKTVIDMIVVAFKLVVQLFS